MNLLPVVQRELIEASRRRSNFFGRVAVALLGAILGTIMLATAADNGRDLFQAVTFLAFVAALLSGVFLTADSLRFERREGTLGLLFLTDLHGYDVILGKLSSAGINTLAGLFALFPVLSISWLLGGVSLREFWCTCAMLIATLLLSLSFGMWVSSRGRRPGEGLLQTAVGMAIFAIGFPLLSALAALSPYTEILKPLLDVNPWHGLGSAQNQNCGANPGEFLRDLVGLFAWSAVAIVLASRTLLGNWRDDYSVRPQNHSPLLRPVARRFGAAINRRLLFRSPVAALAGYSLAVKRLVWWSSGIVLLPAWIILVFPYLESAFGGVAETLFASLVGLLIGYVLLAAWQATGFFCDATRSGWLELLLTTPLHDEEFLSGQWIVMRQIFVVPVALIFLTLIWAVIRADHSSHAMVPLVIGLGEAVVHLLAAAWIGASFGLRNPRRHIAFLKTLGVLLLPKLACICPVCEPIAMVIVLASFRARFEPGLRAMLDPSKAGPATEQLPNASGPKPNLPAR